MPTGIAIFGAFAAILVLIGGAGFLAVRRINKGPSGSPKAPDEEKLKEWEAMAGGYKAGRKTEEAVTASEPWKMLDTVQAAIDGRMRVPMSASVTLHSLEDYKAFDPVEWLREGSDAEELKDLLRQSDRALALWRDVRHDIDKACVAACDEADAAVKDACLERAGAMLEGLSGDFAVRYSYHDPATGRNYAYKRSAPRAAIAELAGETRAAPDGADGDPARRHRELLKSGYRCARCGRSPLTGGVLKIYPVPGGAWECLCDNCGT